MSKNTLLSELINYISANASGNVVIAAPSSGYALDVTGTGRFTSSLAATNFILSGGTGNTGLYYGHTDRLVLANYTAGGIDFEVNGGSILMTLFPSGNLGIGASLTDAGYKLDVSGTGRFTSTLTISSSAMGAQINGGTFTQGTASSYALGVANGGGYDLTLGTSSTAGVIQTWSSKPLALNPQGNYVGIGTNAPSMRLSVIGDGSYTSGEVAVSEHVDQIGTSAKRGIILGYYANGSSATAGFIRVPNNGNLLINPSGGNIGIGTTSPSANSRLHVYKAGGSYDTIVADGDVGTNTGYAIYEGGSPKYAIYSNGAGGNDSFNIYNFGASSNSLTILTNGNVGIGTSSPGYKLQIINAANGYAFGINGGASSATYLASYLSDGGASFGTRSNHSLGLYTNDTDRMLITSNGHIGIRATPSSSWGTNMSALQIGTGGVLSNYTGSNNNFQVGVNFYDNGAGSQLRLYTGGASKLDFGSNEIYFYNAASGSAGAAITFTERMRITSGGNVLVGTTSDAGYKLQVNGSATIAGGVNFYNYTSFQTSTKTTTSGSNLTFVMNNDYGQGAGGDNVGGLVVINISQANSNVAYPNAVWVGTVINPRGAGATITQISTTKSGGVSSVSVTGNSSNQIVVNATMADGSNYRASMTFIGGAGVS